MSEIASNHIDRPYIRFAGAVGIVAAAFVLRSAIQYFLGTSLPPLITYYPAIMVASLLTGFWPGICATFLSALLAVLLSFPSLAHFRLARSSDLVALSFFCGMGAFMSMVAEGFRRNQQKAAAYDAGIALRESQRRLQLAGDLLRFSFDAIIVWKVGGGIESWNHGAELLYGYTEQEVLGQVAPIVLKTKLPISTDQIKAHLREFGDWEGEMCHTTKDGREIIVAARLQQPPPGPDGVIRVLETNRDITERKKSHERLRTQEGLLRDVGRLAGVGGWEFDPATGAGSWTEEVAAIHDLDSGAAPDIQTGLHFYSESSRPLIEKAVHEAIELAKPYDLELELISGKGVRKWVRTTGHPIIENGKVVKVRGAIQDITVRKRSEQQILDLNQQLEERVRQRTAELQTINQELEAFSYSVSHDLRGPLRAMEGFSQALAEESRDLSEKGRHYVTRIRTAALRMDELINDILRLSKLSRTQMNPKRLNLSEMAQSVADDLRHNSPDRHVEIRIQPDLTVTADIGLLRIALQNLFANAWKFTLTRECATIEFGRLNDSGTPTFFIRDNGVGFNPELADRLFVPFQRLHSEVEFAGTGIGLATVQRVIHRHGGRIWAQSVEGEGATFFFEMGTS